MSDAPEVAGQTDAASGSNSGPVSAAKSAVSIEGTYTVTIKKVDDKSGPAAGPNAAVDTNSVTGSSQQSVDGSGQNAKTEQPVVVEVGGSRRRQRRQKQKSKKRANKRRTRSRSRSRK